MILQRLEIASFAGLSNRTVEFAPGMNVILGPNEAGKSSLFQALLHLLLTPSKQSKPDFQKNLQRHLPAGGGDTIGGSLVFSAEGGTYRLTRRWGGTVRAELELPDGSVQSDGSVVEQHLARLLPAGAGTMRSVFLTYQSGLSHTLREIEPDTLRDLGDLLRRAVAETDGISVVGFRQRLDEQHHRFFSRWDLLRDGPEGGRGVQNPYRKEVGEVLRAYYHREELNQRHRKVVEQEGRFEEISAKIRSIEERLSDAEEFVRTHRKAVDDAGKRNAAEMNLRMQEQELAGLKERYDAWPRLEQELADRERTLPGLRESRTQLEIERDRSGRAREAGELRERFDRAAGCAGELRTAEEELAGIPALDRERIARIRQLAASAGQYRARLQGGDLSVRLHPAKAMDLVVRSGGDRPRSVRAEAGTPVDLRGAGQLRIEHEDFTIDISAGGDAPKVRDELARREAELAGILKELGLPDAEAAETAALRYQDAARRRDDARTRLREALGGREYAELEKAALAAEPIAGNIRSPEEIATDLALIGERIRRTGEEADGFREKLRLLSEAHGSRDGLFRNIMRIGAESERAAAELSVLAPLPEGCEDSDAFIRRFREREEERDRLRREVGTLAVEQARIEESMDEESAEELSRQLDRAEEEYGRVLARGRAIERIRDAAAEIDGEADHAGLQALENRLCEYAARLTGNRYRRISMGNLLPAGFYREDGQVLAYDILSAGTRDLFALALRLAAAEFFLDGGKGFLVMDDPLVDLDPDRQDHASRLLLDFASRQQVILFTCHPSHAERFPSDRILQLGTSADVR